MTSTCTPRHQGFPLLFFLLGFVCSSLAAFATPAKFNIPAQPAPAALKLFSKQSGKQVIFIYDDLKDAKANEVIGEMEPADALAKLLAGTGFEVTQSTAKNF